MNKILIVKASLEDVVYDSSLYARVPVFDEDVLLEDRFTTEQRDILVLTYFKELACRVIDSLNE